jgi:hypothetical protein
MAVVTTELVNKAAARAKRVLLRALLDVNVLVARFAGKTIPSHAPRCAGSSETADGGLGGRVVQITPEWLPFGGNVHKRLNPERVSGCHRGGAACAGDRPPRLHEFWPDDASPPGRRRRSMPLASTVPGPAHRRRTCWTLAVSLWRPPWWTLRPRGSRLAAAKGAQKKHLGGDVLAPTIAAASFPRAPGLGRHWRARNTTITPPPVPVGSSARTARITLVRSLSVRTRRASSRCVAWRLRLQNPRVTVREATPPWFSFRSLEPRCPNSARSASIPDSAVPGMAGTLTRAGAGPAQRSRGRKLLFEVPNVGRHGFPRARDAVHLGQCLRALGMKFSVNAQARCRRRPRER